MLQTQKSAAENLGSGTRRSEFHAARTRVYRLRVKQGDLQKSIAGSPAVQTGACKWWCGRLRTSASKVPGEALVPYLDMMAAWLKLKLDEVAHSARNTCCKHELTLAGEARVDNAATTDEAVKKRKVAAKALAKAKAQARMAKAHRLAEAEKARKALEA